MFYVASIVVLQDFPSRVRDPQHVELCSKMSCLSRDRYQLCQLVVCTAVDRGLAVSTMNKESGARQSIDEDSSTSYNISSDCSEVDVVTEFLAASYEQHCSVTFAVSQEGRAEKAVDFEL